MPGAMKAMKTKLKVKTKVAAKAKATASSKGLLPYQIALQQKQAMKVAMMSKKPAGVVAPSSDSVKAPVSKKISTELQVFKLCNRRFCLQYCFCPQQLRLTLVKVHGVKHCPSGRWTSLSGLIRVSLVVKPSSFTRARPRSNNAIRRCN